MKEISHLLFWIYFYKNAVHFVPLLFSFVVIDTKKMIYLYSRELSCPVRLLSGFLFRCLLSPPQLSVLKACRPKTKQAPVTHTSQSKLGRPKREPRPSTATSTLSGRKTSTCELGGKKQLKMLNYMSLRIISLKNVIYTSCFFTRQPCSTKKCVYFFCLTCNLSHHNVSCFCLI